MKTHEKIRQLREAKQWTQEEMAMKLNMSTQGYAKIERGDTRSNLDRLEQISEVFGIDMVELFLLVKEQILILIVQQIRILSIMHSLAHQIQMLKKN